MTDPADGENAGGSAALAPAVETGESSPRPAFAAGFPREPALDALVAAFEAGNFARVREEAPRLVGAVSDEAVKRAAATLLARTRPDPLATTLLLLSAVLLVLLSGWWIAHSGAGSHPS